MGVRNLFTGATAQAQVKLANDLLLINNLKHIDNINKIDDEVFKSITLESTGEKKATVVETINSFFEGTPPLDSGANLETIQTKAKEISTEIKLKDNFQKIANDLLLINHLQHIGNIGNIDDKFFKSITLADPPPATDEEKKGKVLETINSFLDSPSPLGDDASLGQIKNKAKEISKTINLTDLFSEEGIPLDDDDLTKNKLYDRGFTAEKLIGFATREITQDNLKLDLRLPKIFKEDINILKGNTLSKEDKETIFAGITNIIEKAGQDENKKNVVAAILPIVSLLDDDAFKNHKDEVLNSLIKRSYKEEAIKSIFTEEDVGKTKIYNARNSDSSSYQRERKIKQAVGLDHSWTDFAKHYTLEAAFYSFGSVVSLVEGLVRGIAAPIASAVSAVGFEYDWVRDHKLGGDNLTKSHSWSRMARNYMSQDGGHDLEQEGSWVHTSLKVVGFAAGAIVGSAFGILAGASAVVAKAGIAAGKKFTGSHDKKTDFDARMTVNDKATTKAGTEDKIDIKISQDKKNIEFTDTLKDKIQGEQKKEKGLIEILKKKCYIGVGLKFSTTKNVVNANGGYIEVADVFRDNDEGGKEIKKGDKITKITVGDKEIDFINGTFKENGKVTDINLDDVGEKLAKLLLKTDKGEQVKLTVYGKDNDIELDKKVFIKNEGERKLSDGLNHDFVSIDKANDKDITSAFNKFNGSKTAKTKAKSPSQTIRQAIAEQQVAKEAARSR